MLEKAIASGDVNAMTWRGEMFYAKLKGGEELEPKQHQQMMELSTRAASLNHPKALSMLGAIYGNGLGVDQCLDKAIEYTAKAAKLNNHEAIKHLKMMKHGKEATTPKPNTNNPTMSTMPQIIGHQRNNRVPF